MRSRDGRVLLDGFSVEVASGEIVGFAGVEGNGQRAARRRAVQPARASTPGASRSAVGRSPTGRAGAWRAAGVAVIPEDRHDSGCVLDFSVAENLFIAEPERVTRHGLMDRADRCASKRRN